MLLSGTISTLLYLNADAVLSIFTDDPAVHALGKTILFIEIFLEIGRAVNMSMVMALNAAGDVRAPVTIGIIFMWSVATFGSWLLGVHWGWGLAGSALPEPFKSSDLYFKLSAQVKNTACVDRS